MYHDDNDDDRPDRCFGCAKDSNMCYSLQIENECDVVKYYRTVDITSNVLRLLWHYYYYLCSVHVLKKKEKVN